MRKPINWDKKEVEEATTKILQGLDQRPIKKFSLKDLGIEVV